MMKSGGIRQSDARVKDVTFSDSKITLSNCDEKWRNPTVRRSGERCNVFGQQNNNFQIVMKSGGNLTVAF